MIEWGWAGEARGEREEHRELGKWAHLHGVQEMVSLPCKRQRIICGDLRPCGVAGCVLTSDSVRGRSLAKYSDQEKKGLWASQSSTSQDLMCTQTTWDLVKRWILNV